MLEDHAFGSMTIPLNFSMTAPMFSPLHASSTT
jgi:hypothetical protein